MKRKIIAAILTGLAVWQGVNVYAADLTVCAGTSATFVAYLSAPAAAEAVTCSADAQAKEEEKEKTEINKAEVDLLARLIFAEANTLGEEGMIYCGSVVLNRVASDEFPDTLDGVIYQSGQYACTRNGAINKTPSKKARKIAKKLLKNGSQIPDDVIYQAEFAQGSEAWKVVGNTYFCRK